MPRCSAARTASLIISFLGVFFNFAIAIWLLNAWRSIKWEPESEWEGAIAILKIDGLNLIWGLLAAYFATAAMVCFVGFLGSIKNVPSLIRLYRDYFIADVSFCAISTTIVTYAAFHAQFRTSLCEQLSRQPELMRDIAEMGLSSENCELWFERVVFAFLVFAIVLLVHFLVAVSNYHKELTRHHRTDLLLSTPSQTRQRPSSLKRIYLLSESAGARCPSGDVVYAPVPLRTLSPEAAQDLRSSATEAWISPTPGDLETHRRHRLHNAFQRPRTGPICLQLSPDEGLLPHCDK